MRKKLTNRLLKQAGRSGSSKSGDGPPGRSGRSSQEHGVQRGSLDWKTALERLAPVRHRWDLAILCNLQETPGCRPSGLLAAINARADPERQLSPQVLSGRLRTLEHDGYIRHRDLSATPLHRVYFLRPPGRALISDLCLIMSPSDQPPAR